MNKILKDYQHFLKIKGLSDTTIKNYVSDVRKFLIWKKSEIKTAPGPVASFEPSSILNEITPQLLNKYKLYLTRINVPAKTTNRHFSALRSFGGFLKREKLLMINPAHKLENIPQKQISKEDPNLDIHEKITEILEKHKKTIIISLIVLGLIILLLILGIIAYKRLNKKAEQAEILLEESVPMPKKTSDTETKPTGTEYGQEPSDSDGKDKSVIDMTVDYALNSRALQGYTPSASGSANKVIVLTEDGDLVLGEEDPGIYATSGLLTISADEILMMTNLGTNGNITLSPDGSGALYFHLGGGMGDHLRITNANISRGDLISAYAGNNLTGYNLLKLSSGTTETDRFTISTEGDMYLSRNASISGNLNVNGNASISGTLTANSFNGDLLIDQYIKHSGDEDTYLNFEDDSLKIDIGTTKFLHFSEGTDPDVLHGNYNNEDVDFRWDSKDYDYLIYADVSTDRVGIGTNTPNYKLDVRGNAYFGGTMHIAGDLLPNNDGQYNIGSSTSEWKDLYIDGAGYLDTAQIGTDDYASFDINGDLTFVDSDSGSSITGPAGGALTIQSGSNNNLILSSGTGNVDLTATIFDIDSAAIDLSSQATDIDIIDNTASALTISEGANNYFLITTADDNEIVTLDLPAGGGTSLTGNLFISNIAKTINIGSGTAADTINIGVDGSTADDINLGGLATSTIDILGVTSLGDGGTTNYAQFSAVGDLSFFGTGDTIAGPTTSDLNFTSAADGFNFTLGEGAGDDFIVDSTTLVVESDNDRVGIGTTGPGYRLDVQETKTDTSGIHYLSRNFLTVNPASASTGNFTGQYNYTIASSQNINTLIGTHNYVDNAGSSIITNAFGTKNDICGNIAGGTITNAYGSYNEVSRQASTITNGYSIYLADTLATNDYGLYQASSNDTNYFAGNVGIGQVSPGAKLEVETADADNAIGLIVDQNDTGDYDALQIFNAGTGRAIEVQDGTNVVFSIENDGLTAVSNSDFTDGVDNIYADDLGDLYVEQDLEVDGTIYGAISSPGSTFGNIQIAITDDQTIDTSSGALTITGNAASAWSTSAGALNITGDEGLTLSSTDTAGINIQSGALGIELDPFNNAVVSGGDNADDLGTATNVWRAGYFTTIQGGTSDPLTITATAVEDVDDLTIQTTGSEGDIVISSADDVSIGGSVFTFTPTSTYTVNATGAIDIDSDSTFTLGSTRLIYASDYAAGNTTTEAISLKSSVDLINADDELLQIGDAGGDFLTVLGNGYVGIGTTGPNAVLSISSMLPSALTIESTNAHSGYRNWGIRGNSVNVGDFDIRQSNAHLGDPITAGTSRLYIQNSGNVGIGTTGPGAKLEVEDSDGGLGFLLDTEESTGATNIFSVISDSGGDENTILNLTAAGDLSIDGAYTAGGASTVYADGTITKTTGSSLSVVLGGAGGDDFIVDGTTLVVESDNDRVGIGTTSPGTQLEITKTFRVSGNYSDPVSGEGLEARWFSADSRGSIMSYDRSAIAYRVFDLDGSSLLLNTHSGGNVGIGDSTPTEAQLVLSGNLYVGSFASSGTAALCWDNSLGSLINDCSGNPVADYAEIYPTKQDVEYGEIVSLSNDFVEIKYSTTDENGNILPNETRRIPKLIKSNIPYQKNIIGITSPNWSDFSSTGHGSVKNENNPAPIALSGRVLVKVSNINGPIHAGDPITSSGIPGVGMKATKPGGIVGKALENWDKEDSGKIMVFVNVSWYDPDVYLTDTGDVQIIAETYDGLLDPSEVSFRLVDKTGEIVDRMGNFAEVAVAKLKAGLVETTNLITENLVATKGIFQSITTNNASISELITTNIQSERLISPLVETENLIARTIETEMIKPLADSELVFQVQSSKFKVQSEDKELFALDSEGNATFSGELTADSGRFKKLYADSIEGLEARINKIFQKGPSLQDGKDGPLSEEIELGSEIASISALLADLINHQSLITNHQDYLDISSIDADSGIFNEFLAVLGQAVMTNLEVTNSLVIQNSMHITNNSIGVTGNQCSNEAMEQCNNDILYLQKTGIGGIDLMAGALTIGENGDVNITGSLTVGGSLITSHIKPNDDLTVELEATTAGKVQSSKFKVQSSIGEEVASIDASGSATFSKLNIASGEDSIASLQNDSEKLEITANSTANKAILSAYETEIIINNQNISKNSLIYITPASNTNNTVLYVKNKKDGLDGYFTVAVDTPINRDIEFNWWIIN